MEMPRLNFPAYGFRITVRDGKRFIWDRLRGLWLRCTPEEWVRQHVVRWLEEDRGVVAQYIVQEYAVDVGGQRQRADIVVMGRDMVPVVVVECKAPGVGIDRETLCQAVRYNSVAGARYIMLTNGSQHFIYEKSAGGDYLPTSSLPVL